MTLFSTHGDVVVGFAIFDIVIFQKKGKKKRKKALLHSMWKLVGTRWNRLAMVCEKKSGEECQALQKSTNVPISLKTCLVWKIVRTPLLVVNKNNHLSKQIFISILQMKSSSTCLIPASLCEGPFFYFYVESSPSTFMHHLREHSCHSEYNVHSPKLYYWLIYDYGFACS
jgi:hypothetical protein